jgi:hypothetical protein
MEMMRRFEPLANQSRILLGLREVHRGGLCGFLKVVECNLVVLIGHCHLAHQIIGGGNIERLDKTRERLGY